MKLKLFIGRLQDLYAQYGDVEVRIETTNDSGDSQPAYPVNDFAPSIDDWHDGQPDPNPRKIVVIR